MDYDQPAEFPIERDPYAVPSNHFTYASGVSRAAVNGEKWKKLRALNMLAVESAKHTRASHTA